MNENPQHHQHAHSGQHFQHYVTLWFTPCQLPSQTLTPIHTHLCLSGPSEVIVALSTNPQLLDVSLAGHSIGLVVLHSTVSSAAHRSWACRDNLVSVLLLSAESPTFLADHRSGTIACMHIRRQQLTNVSAAAEVWVQLPMQG
jgi:hypothetical protein